MKIERIKNKKKKLDQYLPLPKDFEKNIEEWFRIELTYTSNAIEGNTLTRQETALVVEKDIAVGGKSLKELLEAKNHAKAFDLIKRLSKQKKDLISEKDILEIHSIILEGIDNSNSGYYRRVPVRIAGSKVVLPNPLKVPQLMKEFINFLKSSKNLHPIELAAMAHYKLVTIHPFIDGNGRTARLLMNLILMKSGYAPAIIRKKDRLIYINSLEKAQIGGSNEDYLDIIYKAVDRSLDIYIETLCGKNKISKLEKGNVKLLKIGELAKKANLTVSTIRHWTKEELIEPYEITDSGYQLYDIKTLKLIERIKELKNKRYTLEEIKKHL